VTESMTDPRSITPKILYPEWQHEYQAAILESDPKQLTERTKAAERAIFVRLQAISGSADSDAERHAIEDALANLRILKRESLGFPDWEKK
jgi:hypothetical protein